jgi:hypothetical protein
MDTPAYLRSACLIGAAKAFHFVQSKSPHTTTRKVAILQVEMALHNKTSAHFMKTSSCGRAMRASLSPLLPLVAAAPSPSGGELPHILLVLVGDLGYGNVGWLREQNNATTPEVQSPNLGALVKSGIQLPRFYVPRARSPTRSSLQPKQAGCLSTSTFMMQTRRSAALLQQRARALGSRGMTGTAEKLEQAGHAAHVAGKWDAASYHP